MTNKIKKITFLLVLTALFSSCSTVYELGDLTMVSSRNIETKMDYVLIKNYSGGSKKEIKKALKKTKATNLETAINETVKNVAGGEFLKNANFYAIKRGKKFSYYAEGDVWGLQGNESFRGFKVGDTVQWKELTVTKKGVITGLTDSEKCMVKEIGQENSTSLKYSSITKINE
jgi:hypothetical protein